MKRALRMRSHEPPAGLSAGTERGTRPEQPEAGHLEVRGRAGRGARGIPVVPGMRVRPAWRRPPALRPGGVIGVAAPAGPPRAAALANGLGALRAAGFEVALAPGLLERRGYLAGDDARRAADLMALLSDPAVDAVVCARGGYGAMRMLPYCDLRPLRRRPKALVGFSDITALHLALGAHGLVSFHGPMVESPAGGFPAANLEGLLRALTERAPLGALRPPEGAPIPRRLSPGTARGPLIGGNLTLLAASLGTPWEIRTEGCIVLLEDTGETPYRLDRYLTQLCLAGKLQEAAGFAIGELVDCGEGAPGPLDVFAECLVPLGKPILADLPLGHGPSRWTVPLGVEVELDADNGTLTVLQSAVT